MNLLAIKTAVITGAASGIGLALATKAARLGMRVVLADVEKDKLITVTNSLSEQNYKVLACPTDVTKEKDLINLANQTISHFGVPDLLINNAGIGGPIGPIWDVSLQQLEITWNVNVMGIVHGLRAFIPHLIARNEPAYVVNTASMAGFYSAPYLSSYEMSKHAVVALTEALYHDLKMRAPYINVALLCPGWVKTHIVDKDLAVDNKNSDNNAYSDDDLRWLFNFARSVKKGIDPGLVAEQVFAAISANKFYIFTDESMKKDIIEKRLSAILADSKPIAFEA